MTQRGAFTLHGPRFALDVKEAPSLVGVPVHRQSKERLKRELESVGVDEMPLFPELEHSCIHLKRVLENAPVG